MVPYCKSNVLIRSSEIIPKIFLIKTIVQKYDACDISCDYVDRSRLMETILEENRSSIMAFKTALLCFGFFLGESAAWSTSRYNLNKFVIK